MIGTDGAATLLVTALTGATFAASLVLTILIGRRFHREWQRFATNGPLAWVATGRDRPAETARDTPDTEEERAAADARLHRLRAETEAWQERLNDLRRQAAELDRRSQEIETIKLEVARVREEQRLGDEVRAEAAAAVRDAIERDRRIAADLAIGIAEAQHRQAALRDAEAESRARLEELRAELARCLEDQDALRQALDAGRREVERLEHRGLDAAAGTPPPQVEPEPIAPPKPSSRETMPSEPISPAPKAARWSARGQSVVKPRNDSFHADGQTVWRRNEDRFRLASTADGLLAAVSDGAGGSGLFCGAWAGALVGRLPGQPLVGIDELNRWLDGFCLDFHREFAGRARADQRKHSKFVREGSFATLAACWLTRTGPAVSCRWLGYGDSPVLVFDRTGDGLSLVAGHPDSLTDFDRDPHLLNWTTLPTPAALKAGEVTLPERATLVLASDGIGQFILLRYLAALQAGDGNGARLGMVGGLLAEFRRLAGDPGSRVGALAAAHLARPAASFAEDMAGIDRALATESAFGALVDARHKDGLLANDDATLIVINLESSDVSFGTDAVTPS